MSRIAKQPITIPETVTVSQEKNTVRVKGPKGELVLEIDPSLSLEIAKDKISIIGQGEMTKSTILGTTRTILHNMIYGVSTGWVKTLELVGVGFRAAVSGEELQLTIGYSHPVKVKAPRGITFSISENKIQITGADKQQVGEVAAIIRRLRPPEPYKGKGIRYLGEIIRKKAGKAVKAAGVPGGEK